MAEQAEAQAARPEGSSRLAGRRKNLVFGGIFLGIMVAEAVAVALVVRHFSGGAAPAEANQITANHGLDPTEGEKKPEDAEVEIATFRAQNAKARQVMMYDVNVVASVSGEKQTEFKAQLERKRAEILDRFISTIRAADPEILTEPDCSTLRQQFHQILVELLGSEDLVKKVLIPQFNSYREN